MSKYQAGDVSALFSEPKKKTASDSGKKIKSLFAEFYNKPNSSGKFANKNYSQRQLKLKHNEPVSAVTNNSQKKSKKRSMAFPESNQDLRKKAKLEAALPSPTLDKSKTVINNEIYFPRRKVKKFGNGFFKADAAGADTDPSLEFNDGQHDNISVPKVQKWNKKGNDFRFSEQEQTESESFQFVKDDDASPEEKHVTGKKKNRKRNDFKFSEQEPMEGESFQFVQDNDTTPEKKQLSGRKKKHSKRQKDSLDEREETASPKKSNKRNDFKFSEQELVESNSFQFLQDNDTSSEKKQLSGKKKKRSKKQKVDDTESVYQREKKEETACPKKNNKRNDFKFSEQELVESNSFQFLQDNDMSPETKQLSWKKKKRSKKQKVDDTESVDQLEKKEETASIKKNNKRNDFKFSEQESVESESFQFMQDNDTSAEKKHLSGEKKYSKKQKAHDTESLDQQELERSPKKKSVRFEKKANGKNNSSSKEGFSYDISLQKNSEVLNRTLFVGNLPMSVRKQMLEKLFKPYGALQSCRLRGAVPVKVTLPKRVADIKHKFHSGVDSRIGYVVFKNKEHAVAAKALNGSLLEDHHITVNLAFAMGEKITYDQQRSIFVGNLPFNVKNEALWTAFAPYGEIESVRVIRDNTTGVGKGFGYVLFKELQSKKNSLGANITIEDRNVRIKPAQEKKANQPSNKMNSFKRKAKDLKGKSDALQKHKSLKKIMKRERLNHQKKKIANIFKNIKTM